MTSESQLLPPTAAEPLPTEFADWPDLEQWQNSAASVQDGRLLIAGHAVMWQFGEPYMKQLADIATRKGGVILEIGFGMGISARYIQTKPIQKHIIIEMNRDLFQQVELFAQSASVPVEPYLGLWQEVVPQLAAESIDGILFDPYPLNGDDLDYEKQFFAPAYRLLKKGGVLTYFSNEDQQFSPQHLQRLHEAGFTQIESQLCAIDPHPECTYWQSKTILAPVVIK